MTASPNPRNLWADRVIIVRLAHRFATGRHHRASLWVKRVILTRFAHKLRRWLA